MVGHRCLITDIHACVGHGGVCDNLTAVFVAHTNISLTYWSPTTARVMMKNCCKKRDPHERDSPASSIASQLVSRSQTPFRRVLPGEMGSDEQALMSLCAA